ncbi:MAG: ABC transporter permease, partial [Proteobacteria bacterium]|nr:ABC transporter permease [Pseudomonadota bacterium]
MKEGLFYRAGHQTMAFIDYMGDLFLFWVDACRSLVYPPWFVREVINQMYQLGVKSFTLVVVASFAVGLVLAMQGLKVLSWF